MKQADLYKHKTTEIFDQIILKTQALSDEIIRWKPAEDVWSILQILCHVEECTNYWLDELQSVIKQPGVEWGRGLQHEGRLAAVNAAEDRSTIEVIESLTQAKQKAVHVLESMNDDQLLIESPHRNPKFGIKPMSFLLDHFIVEHFEKHLYQISRNLLQHAEQQ